MCTPWWSLLTLIYLCASMAHAARTDPAAAFPAAAPVLAEIRGQDQTDTLARQFATLELLQDALKTLAMPPRSNQLPPTALAKYREYGLALQRLWEAVPPHYETTCKQGLLSNLNLLKGCDKKELVETISRYRRSPEFARSLLERHLPLADVNRFIATATTLNRVAPARTTAFDRAYAGLSEPFRAAGLSEPFRIPGALALLSLAWLLPAALAYVLIARDRAETRTQHFSAWGPDGHYVGKSETPTGRTIQGDPDFARFVALAWTLAFLPIVFCLWLLVQGHIHIGVGLAVCAVSLLGVWKLVTALAEADGGVFGLLRRAWYGLLGLATLHLLAWMVYLAIVWLG